MKITHKGIMNIGRLAYFAVGVIFLSACNLFGFYQPTQEASPLTKTIELTFASAPPYAEPGYEQIEVRTLDSESIDLDVTLLFKIDPSMISQIQQQGGENYLLTVLKPIVQSGIQDVTAHYSARNIYADNNKRIQWIADMQTAVQQRLVEKGFVYEDFLVRNVQFTKAFTDQIEQEFIATRTIEAQRRIVTPTP